MRNKELVAVYGAGHAGMADALRMDHADRLKKIRSLAKRYSATSRDLDRILRFDFDKTKNKWSVHEEFDKDIEQATR